MKKGVRVFFIMYNLFVLGVGVYLIDFELRADNFIKRFLNNPVYWLLFLWTFLAILSLAFNIEKLIGRARKSKIYKFTRFGDLIFCVTMTFVTFLFASSLFFYIEEDLKSEFYGEDLAISISILIISLGASITMFLDNLKYHKSFDIPSSDSLIEGIGKESD